MAGRFPLYTDADIDGPVVKALRAAGWDILRASIAEAWFLEGRKFPGVVRWPRSHPIAHLKPKR